MISCPLKSPHAVVIIYDFYDSNQILTSPHKRLVGIYERNVIHKINSNHNHDNNTG